MTAMEPHTNTVFSHIVKKRLSHEAEDVATEALAFILRSSEAARRGLMRFLRTIQPDLPSLSFRTQQSEDLVRPDMCGLDDSNTVRVFLENKFWAGLTANQPVEYLRRLAGHSESSVLLVVAPEARQKTVWYELERRLDAATITAVQTQPPAGVTWVVETDTGPTLALTSWNHLLAAIEAQLADEPRRRRDLLQLQALCKAVDIEAFVPISPGELSDQRTPAFLLNLGIVVEAAVDSAVAAGSLSTKGLGPSSSWERIGRYVRFPDAEGLRLWFGTHLRLWRDYGRTPLWLVFRSSKWSRAPEVRALLEPWAQDKGVFVAMDGDEFVVAIDVPTEVEKDRVVQSIVSFFGDVAIQLSALPEREK